MTQAEQLAAFAGRASYDMLSEQAREQIKIRVLDSLGCAIGALEGDPVRAVRGQVDAFGGTAQCTLIGGGHSSLDRAVLYNTALVRYLDFMDFFLATGETCHPSCNVGSVLAASEYAGAAGRDFLAALALAYQVQCRLTETAPLMQRGFDHIAQMCFVLLRRGWRVARLEPGRAPDRQRAGPLRHAVARSGHHARQPYHTVDVDKVWRRRPQRSPPCWQPIWRGAASPAL